jgi:hypothetical protein
MGQSDHQRVKLSLDRGQPLGGTPWTESMARRLGLEFTLNPPGRPKSREE